MSNLPSEVLSAYNNFATGLMFGFSKIGIVQPLWTVKLRIQQNKPFTFNPFILFKGLGFNVVGYPFATATQVMFYQGLQDSFEHEGSANYSLFCGFAVGMASGTVICLNDFIMTQHSLGNLTYRQSLAKLSSTYNYRQFFTGISITCMREGGYATCYLAVPQLIKPYVDNYINNEKLSTFIASLLSGVIATYITQPADTIKSAQQTSVISLKEAVSHIYRNGSSMGFFRGASARCAQVTAGIVLLDHLKQSYLDEDSQNSNIPSR